MRLLVCGSRNWHDKTTLFEVLDRKLEAVINAGVPGYFEIVNGTAPGADAQAHEWAMLRERPSHSFPARWGTFHKAAGPVRNQQMLDYLLERPEGEREVFAFSNDLEHSRGTRDMVVRSIKAGVKVRAFTSDMEYEPQELREVMGL